MTEARDLRKEIVELLVDLPELLDPRGRSSILFAIGLEQKILQKIDYTGAPLVFANHLIEQLYRFGNLQRNQHALDALLEGLKQYFGVDKQAKIYVLRERLRIHLAEGEICQEDTPSPVFHAVDFKQEDIFAYYNTFVGRQQEIDAIQEFLQGDGGEYLLIQGKAGIGKTALVAELVRRSANKDFGEQVSCVVFFIREEGGRNTPERYLDALNHQLLRLLGDYAEIPIHLAKKRRQYERLWENVATQVSPSNRVLVLIDGLDESARQGKQPLAEYFPATIPPYIHWIVTSRPLPDVLDAIPTTHVLRKARSHRLSGLEPQEVRELLALNGDRIERSESFITNLIKHTNGEPLFLRFLCQNIAEWGADADAHLEEIPKSVSEFFQQQLRFLWERTEQARNRNLIMEILTTLLVSFAGLTVKELAGILQRKVFEIRECIRLIERFLLGEESYELMHLEFRRTIEEELVREEDKQEALDVILLYCERSWQKDASQERYAIRYYLRHLWSCQRYPEMFALCEAGYLDVKLQRLISPELMEEDYQFLYDACQQEGDLVRLLRWGLYRAKIADKAAALRDITTLPEAIGTIAQRGREDWWERGVGLCSLIPGNTGKIQGLLGLCKGLETGAREVPETVFERIETLLGEIPSSEHRDGLACDYVQERCRWGSPYLEQALEAAVRIENEKPHSEALVAVAQGYARLNDGVTAIEMLGHVLDATFQIGSEGPRAEALAVVAQGYTQVGRIDIAIEVLGQAGDAATRIEDESSRSQVLAAVAHGYAQVRDIATAVRGLEQVLDAAAQIVADRPRFIVFAAVAQGYARLDDVAAATWGLEQVLDTAVRIGNERSLASTLAAVAKGYAQIGKVASSARGLGQVLDAATRIVADSPRFDVFVAVAQGYAQIGKVTTAAEVFGQAMDAAHRIEDEMSRSVALAEVAQGYAQMEEDSIAVEMLGQAEDFVTRIGEEWLRCYALFAVAQGYSQMKDVAAAVRGLEQVLDAAAQIVEDRPRFLVFSAVAQGYAQLDDVAAATGGLEQVLDTAVRIENERSRARLLAATAEGYAQIGNVATAAEDLKRVLDATTQLEGMWNRSAVLSIHTTTKSIFHPRIEDEWDRSHVLSTVAGGYAQIGEIATAVRGLEQVLDTATRIIEDGPRFHVLAAVTQGYAQVGEVATAIKGLGQVLDVAIQIEDERWRSSALSTVAQAYARMGEVTTATEVFGQAMDAAAQIEDDWLRSDHLPRVLSTVAQGYAQVGEVTTAAEGLRQVLDVMAQLEGKWDRSGVISTVTEGYAQIGEVATAIKGLGQVLDVAIQIEDERWRSSALSTVAQGYVQIGDVASSARGLGQVLDAAHRIVADSPRFHVFVAVAQGYAQIGKVATAAEVFGQAMDAAHRIENERSRSEALVVVAQGYAEVGAVATAVEVFGQAVDATHRIGNEMSRSGALATVVRGYAQIDDVETMIGGLEQVLDAVHRIEDEGSRSESLAVMAQSYAEVGAVATAVEVFGQAVDIAHRIGDERSRSEALATVAQGFARVMKIPEACSLLISVSEDDHFDKACNVIFTTVENLSEDHASDILIDTLYRVLPLASQYSRYVYLQVVQYALPALVKHLPPEQVRPILAFLEEQWSVK